MRHRKLPWIILFISIILISLFLFTVEKPKPAPSSHAETIPPQVEPSPVAITTNLAPLKKRKMPETLKTADDTNALYFEVDGNLAVFFDDMVLGELKDNADLTSGFTEIPKIELWSLPIPYVISPDVPSPKRIEDAIRYFEQNTPIRFKPYAGEEDAIVFVVADKHCRSYLGKKSGLQPVYLSANCGPQEIMHELMHAIGFIHEQSREDRDSFVEIIWNNIDPTKKSQFQKTPDQMQIVSGSEFDFSSIMLYQPNIFSKDSNLPTMKSKTDLSISPSQNGLSIKDIERLQRLYGN